MGTIKIFGAREHNLKNISLEIPKNSLVVITGLSGSGKSSLAFNTIYAEGQRRYIESLSSYARQFLDRLDKPDVDKIEGLTPAVAIEQKSTSKNPRSTVGTVTEIYDYLRLLYSRVGVQHCHKCDQPISSMSSQEIIHEVLKLPKNSKLIILAPLVEEKKGSFNELLQKLRKEGYIRAVIDGITVRLDEEIELSKNKKHTIKVIVDRVVVKEENKERIVEDIERALSLGDGEVEIELVEEKKQLHFSQKRACSRCKVSFEPLEPLSFSFNSPKGACEECDGLGVKYLIDFSKILKPNTPLLKLFPTKSSHFKLFKLFCEGEGIDLNRSFEELKEDQQKAILYGTSKKFFFRLGRKYVTKSWRGLIKVMYEDLKEYAVEKECPRCKGYRLKLESLAVKVANKGLREILDLPIEEAVKFFDSKENFSYLSKGEQRIAEPILKEIRERLFFLVDVGLGYLTLGRDARTISGGEAQRIRIASQIGSGLTGVTYVLDEPSIGLHERDTLKLVNTLKNLQKKGNTVIVVEHDRKTIEAADFIVDMGPGAGKFGGEIVFSGSLEELKKSDTLTAKYLTKKGVFYSKGRKPQGWLTLKNVNINNISNLKVSFPLKNFVVVSGVSGSGKSSLVLQTLLPVVKEALHRKIKKIERVEVEGVENLDKVISLDQTPIGRTPKSNPATYTGAMDDIRELFASTKEAKMRGYGISRFSFNLKGGRCEKCKGEGEIKIEMHFLPDVMIKCEACKGKRYNSQTLEIKYKGKNIAEVLEMSVDEAVEFFKAIPKLHKKLKTLQDVGLGYLTLGQNAVTLSGGEAQRVKIAKELSKRSTGKTLYILDEPTTGLHFYDIEKLVNVLQRLVDLGNSVIVIEHNLDVIKSADYIIDMGPEGGNKGGKIVAQGTPKEVAKTNTHTGRFLREELP